MIYYTKNLSLQFEGKVFEPLLNYYCCPIKPDDFSTNNVMDSWCVSMEVTDETEPESVQPAKLTR